LAVPLTIAIKPIEDRATRGRVHAHVGEIIRVDESERLIIYALIDE